jgi:serine/threonine protein kinase
MTGQTIGQFEVLEQIGQGGMGVVYKARDTRLDRFVAIKISAAQFTERFEREARAIAALNHPHICALYDVGSDYLVMEFVDGPTLAERIKAETIPLEEALAIARQITEAVEAAHEKGIVHRDLKPANVKISPEGVVKVLDFGLAKAMSSDTAPARPALLTHTYHASHHGRRDPWHCRVHDARASAGQEADAFHVRPLPLPLSPLWQRFLSAAPRRPKLMTTRPKPSWPAQIHPVWNFADFFRARTGPSGQICNSIIERNKLLS